MKQHDATLSGTMKEFLNTKFDDLLKLRLLSMSIQLCIIIDFYLIPYTETRISPKQLTKQK